MASSIYMIVLVGWVIALLFFYHKVFTVYYFNLGHGLLKELGVSFILGLIMTALTFYFWWLTAIIIVVAGLLLKKKFSSNVPFIIAAVLALIVAILGISMRKETDNDVTTADTQVEEGMEKAAAEGHAGEAVEVEEEPEQFGIEEMEEEPEPFGIEEMEEEPEPFGIEEMEEEPEPFGIEEMEEEPEQFDIDEAEEGPEQANIDKAGDEFEDISMNGKYAGIGDSGLFVQEGAEGNILVTITDIGAEYASDDNGSYYILYVDTEIENNTNVSARLGAETDISVYLDDYQYNNDDPQKYMQMYLSGFNGDWYEINAGRKGKGVFYTAITEADADEAENIEVEIVDSNLTILFKDNGQWLYGGQTASVSNNGSSGIIS